MVRMQPLKALLIERRNHRNEMKEAAFYRLNMPENALSQPKHIPAGVYDVIGKKQANRDDFAFGEQAVLV